MIAFSFNGLQSLLINFLVNWNTKNGQNLILNDLALAIITSRKVETR